MNAEQYRLFSGPARTLPLPMQSKLASLQNAVMMAERNPKRAGMVLDRQTIGDLTRCSKLKNDLHAVHLTNCSQAACVVQLSSARLECPNGDIIAQASFISGGHVLACTGQPTI